MLSRKLEINKYIHTYRNVGLVLGCSASKKEVVRMCLCVDYFVFDLEKKHMVSCILAVMMGNVLLGDQYACVFLHCIRPKGFESAYIVNCASFLRNGVFKSCIKWRGAGLEMLL